METKIGKQTIFTAKRFNKGIVLLLLLFLHPVFSQNLDMENDTIQMNELEVVKKSNKLKVKTLRLEGPCYYPENMHNAEEIITLVEKLPKGTLKSVSFYFNELYTKHEESDKFRDNEFELVLYNANDDGTPGDSIAHDGLTIKVGRKFSGRITVDLAILALDSPEKMFIGLKRLTPPVGEDEFFIDCTCNGLDKYITMVRKDATAPWERRWQCAALKTEVSVTLHR